jgi:hypothetical protein
MAKERISGNKTEIKIWLISRFTVKSLVNYFRLRMTVIKLFRRVKTRHCDIFVCYLYPKFSSITFNK